MAAKKTVTVEMTVTDLRKLADAARSLSELASAYIIASDSKHAPEKRSSSRPSPR